jgi:hypothetical protein
MMIIIKLKIITDVSWLRLEAFLVLKLSWRGKQQPVDILFTLLVFVWEHHTKYFNGLVQF